MRRPRAAVLWPALVVTCLLPLVDAVTVPAQARTAQAPTVVSLDSLTVPADRITAACRLASMEPPPPGAPRPPVRASIRLWLPGNPWRGAERDGAARVRAWLVPPPRVPDGPPLSRRQMAEFNSRLADDVEEAYGATYRSDDGNVVTVAALRFTSLPPGLPGPGVQPGSRRLRAIVDRTMVDVSGDDGPCLVAVRQYVSEQLPPQ